MKSVRKPASFMSRRRVLLSMIVMNEKPLDARSRDGRLEPQQHELGQVRPEWPRADPVTRGQLLVLHHNSAGFTDDAVGGERLEARPLHLQRGEEPRVEVQVFVGCGSSSAPAPVARYRRRPLFPRPRPPRQLLALGHERQRADRVVEHTVEVDQVKRRIVQVEQRGGVAALGAVDDGATRLLNVATALAVAIPAVDSRSVQITSACSSAVCALTAGMALMAGGLAGRGLCLDGSDGGDGADARVRGRERRKRD